ncbi:MAG: hypothetical protein H7240_01440 [Glaciimonas sp.]|nr:hypothetical protein [Glaciimonas sp.]
MNRAHAEYPAASVLVAPFWQYGPVSMPGFHLLYLEDNQIVLTLIMGDSGKCLQQIDATIDDFLCIR